MRILEFTFEPPSKWYGGGICVSQSLASLSKNNELHYIGPSFNESEFPQICIKDRVFLKDSNNVFIKSLNLIKGVSTKFFQEWKKAVRKINPKDYDIVFVDFSYSDYVVKWAKENNLKVAIRVHNIEHDMVDCVLNSKVHNKYWFRNLINGRIIKSREKKVMESCDYLIFLTREDQRRAIELYGEYVRLKSSVIPVCISKSNTDEVIFVCDEPYILATGSLYYGANSEGIKWFIKNVWKRIQDNFMLPHYKLLIAGKSPDPEMKSLVKEYKNCVLIDSPESIAPYFENAELYLAPIFYGAGMKVKVAEALSYGLQVLGTHHSLIGYEQSIEEGYCKEMKDSDDYVKSILECTSHKLSKEKCKEHFNKYYSIQNSINEYDKVIDIISKK